MKIIKVPAYSYFGTSSVRTDMCFVTGDKVRETLSQYSTGIVQSWTGIQDRNVAKIDKFLGDNVFNNIKDIPLYTIYNNNYHNPTNYPLMMSDFASINSYTGLNIVPIQVPNDFDINSTGQTQSTRTIGLNNSEINSCYFYNTGYKREVETNFDVRYSTPAYGVFGYVTNLPLDSGYDQNVHLTIAFYPEASYFTSDGFYISDETKAKKVFIVEFTITIYHTNDMSDTYISAITIRLNTKNDSSYFNYLQARYGSFNTTNAMITEETTDPEDPYSTGGDSHTGGGDGGGWSGMLDHVDPAQIPALPNVNVCDLGFITMYNPSQAELKTLADYLWSGAFDLNTYKKLFGDPMEGIIGLSVVPVSPSLGGSKNVKIGNIDTGVNMSFLSSNWKEIDCGWVDIEKYVGCFMDADPYTKISLYLPFIGIRSLSADDVNGGSIHVVYHVDVLTGACAAFIQHSSRGVLYTYNGSCITNVPLTAINFSGAIQNAVSAVISGIGTAAGIATGAAPVTMMGAMGMLNSAANTALNSKPHVQRSGNLGGSAGILSILTPYVIIERPALSVPSNMQKFVGQCSNITYTLGNISGFTMVEYVHIEGCTGTADEVAEIEALLKEGVYL